MKIGRKYRNNKSVSNSLYTCTSITPLKRFIVQWTSKSGKEYESIIEPDYEYLYEEQPETVTRYVHWYKYPNGSKEEVFTLTSVKPLNDRERLASEYIKTDIITCEVK